MTLTDPDGKQLFKGSVHPNVQYEYETKTEGEFKLCVSLQDEVYENSKKKIKTDIKFSAEFHRSKSKQSNRVKLHSKCIKFNLTLSLCENRSEQKATEDKRKFKR